MRLFQRKVDPIVERERMLERELAALQDLIEVLDDEARETEQRPRVRSTVRPSRQIPARNPFASGQEVVFEPVDNEPITDPAPLEVETAYYNEHGVKKINLPQIWRRVRNAFNRRPGAQSKFVNYLAAGSIQGIRPLRYERRIARNRFLALFGALLLVLFGVLALIKGQL